MSIRIPTQVVIDKTFGPSTTPGSSSVAGVETQNFILPLDVDNVVMKIYQASISGASSNVNVLFQTSDDGGTTWYDVARSPAIQASGFATSILTGTALWVPIPLTGFVTRTAIVGSVVATGSVITQSSVSGVTGSAASSTLAIGQYSGLPILGQLNRLALIYTGATTTNDGIKVRVLANTQSGGR